MFMINDELSGLIVIDDDVEVSSFFSNIDGIYDGSPLDPLKGYPLHQSMKT